MSIQNFRFCRAPWRMGFCPFSLAGSYRRAHHLSVQNFHFCRAPWRMGFSPILISFFVSGAHHLSVQNFRFCRAPWRMGILPILIGRFVSWAHRRNKNALLLAAKTHPLSAQLGLAGTLLHIYAAADRDMPRQATIRPAARFSAAKAKKRPRRKNPAGTLFGFIQNTALRHQALGPAATSALPASLPSYLTKFLIKRAARSCAFFSHSATSA